MCALACLGVIAASASPAAAISASVDLATTVTDSPDPVNAGTDLTYTITIANNGPGAAASANVADTLPPGTAFVSLSQNSGPAFTCAQPAVGGGGQVSCTIGSLPSGSSAQFTLVVNVAANTAAGTVLSDTATASTTSQDPDTNNDSATATTTVGTSADLQTTISDSPDPVAAGSNLTYTIGLTNAGPSDAANVTIADTLPAGTTFVSLHEDSGPAFSCVQPIPGGTGQISCSIASLPPGSAQFTLVVQVNADAAAGTVLSDTATAGSSGTSDPDSGNDSGTATTTVSTSADLQATIADSPDPVAAGSNLTYTIGLTNAGPSNAADVTLEDALPAGTTFVSLSTPAGFSCTTPAVGGGGMVSCTNLSLAPGTSTFTLVVNVNASTPAASMLIDTASAGASTSDPDSTNDSANAFTTVNASADLQTTISDSPDPVEIGTNLTYTIDLTNAGPSDAASASLSDTLPTGTTFVSLSSPGGFSCSTPLVGGGGAVSCSTASLPAGAAVQFTLVVHVGSSVTPGSTISDTATASTSTTDPDSTNDAATTTTRAETATNLGVDMSDSPDPVTRGEKIDYAIVIQPTFGTARDVQLTDNLPAGTEFVSITQTDSGPQFTCTTPAVGSGGSVSCSVASLSSGSAAANLHLVVRVPATATVGSTVSNTATVSTASFDGDPGNDSATTQTTVAAAPDLAVTLSGDPDPVRAGEDIAYTLLVDNSSNRVANATITDALPAGTTFVSLQVPGGTCNTPAPGASGTVSCDVAVGAGSQVVADLEVRVDPGAASGSTITDTATVTQAVADTNPGNESATETTGVTAAADLSTTIAGSPDPVTAGGNVTYRVVVHNDGPSDAHGVSVTMPLPPSTSFVSATQASGPHFDCTSDSTGISCAGPLLPAGGDAAFDFVLSTPRSTLSRDITSAAQAFTTTPDPRLGNDRSTTTTHVTGLPAAEAQKLTLGNAVETSRSGAITFPVTCLNIDTGYCMTTLTITFKRPHQNLTTIKRKLRLAAGKSVPYISPSRSQRQKIKAIRRLGIRVTLTNPPGTPVSRDSVLSGSARTRR